jgi:hypothetical protein
LFSDGGLWSTIKAKEFSQCWDLHHQGAGITAPEDKLDFSNFDFDKHFFIIHYTIVCREF